MSRQDKDISRLSRREREIIHAIFALGNRATASDIRTRLADPPVDASVRVMLRRLEEKGYLQHEQEGLRYVYSAVTSPVVEKRRVLRQYIDTFFGGSLRDVVLALVRQGAWEDDDLDALKSEIERVRARRKRPKT